MGALNQRGSVLILSLWVLTLMVVTAASLSYRAALELRLTRYQEDEIRLIETAKKTVREDAGRADRTDLEEESTKVDLNSAPKEKLSQLFNGHPEIVSAIIQWRSRLNAGAQSDDYSGLGYKARHGPFKSVEELLLVKHMTPELFEEVREKLTVHGSDGAVRFRWVARLPDSAVNKSLEVVASRRSPAGRVFSWRENVR